MLIFPFDKGEYPLGHNLDWQKTLRLSLVESGHLDGLDLDELLDASNNRSLPLKISSFVVAESS